MARPRTTLDWDPGSARDVQLRADLGRFKARARGARLKDLALLGLEAERAGVRLVPTTEGASGRALLLPSGGVHAAPAPMPPHETSVPPIGTPSPLSAGHLTGLLELLDVL